jgi:hypothetical protein
MERPGKVGPTTDVGGDVPNCPVCRGPVIYTIVEDDRRAFCADCHAGWILAGPTPVRLLLPKRRRSVWERLMEEEPEPHPTKPGGWPRSA